MSDSPQVAPHPRYTIQGRTVTLPCVVRDASSATATFLVDATRARDLLPGSEFEVVEMLPGRALLSLGCIDYRDNDLGDYNEISIALFVRRRSESVGLPILGPAAALLRGRLPTFIHRLPVNQEFTCEAGRTIWGFPKTVDEITLEEFGERLRCRWSVGGQHVFSFTAPRGGTRTLPEQSLVTYTYLDGAPHQTRFVSRADDVGFRLGGMDLDLGDHPIADELRGLGLPRRALFSVWMGRMQARFEAPEKL